MHSTAQHSTARCGVHNDAAWSVTLLAAHLGEARVDAATLLAAAAPLLLHGLGLQAVKRSEVTRCAYWGMDFRVEKPKACQAQCDRRQLPVGGGVGGLLSVGQGPIVSIPSSTRFPNQAFPSKS
jgi:hypothetical protein